MEISRFVVVGYRGMMLQVAEVLIVLDLGWFWTREGKRVKVKFLLKNVCKSE